MITAQNANQIPTKKLKHHVVHIGNWDCKRRDDCHSYREFETMDEALAYMWGMAKAKRPQKCWYFAPRGMEWTTNGHMRLARCSDRLMEMADNYRKEDDAITEVVSDECDEEAAYYAELDRGYAQDRI